MSASRMQDACIIAVAGLALWLSNGESVRAESLRAGGTGAALETLRRLGTAFATFEPDTRIEVVDGLGSSGGIAAVAAGAIDFSVSGRPLGPADDASLKASLIARTPFGLVSANSNPGDIKSDDVAVLFGSTTSVWPDGKPVRPILRPRTDIDSHLLVSTFRNMASALEKLRQRAEVPVGATDQDNARLAEGIAGSLTAMTLAQSHTENLRLRFLSIDGIAPTLENFESGRYPYGKDFYLVVSSRSMPALDRFMAFVRSAEGIAVLRNNGSLPVRR
ncbi:substrate-binding domain-containing protein [Bradyrhizobium sp.]|uniref:substrate-binding domain-containing protein n=1 Tax=Bradyrhizobium sp. TaxID=376 RepID=UPI002737059B|nr:substrate-binding domain-containing protein [Bradyrhizobium sp.]MDP3693226.1 substrate-binding domain-containing protein [Bradyrhizobium sp.]